LSDDPRFAEPLYTVAQAARLVGMSPSTLISWAKGYEHRFRGRPTVTKGPVVTSLPARSGATIPFVGLVEAMVVQAFRRTELSLQRIRKALDVLAAEGDIVHPLASRRLYTDGAEVLYDYATDAGDGQLRLLTVVSSGQRVFHEVVDSYLRRVHFADDPWASEVIVPVTPREVLRVRPGVASGDPVFMAGGAPLSAVLSRRKAGESIASLSDDYGIPIEDLSEALDAVRATPIAA
jgi:uncharacterized protein (DUF433 family)